jgi:hypothetical protein
VHRDGDTQYALDAIELWRLFRACPLPPRAREADEQDNSNRSAEEISTALNATNNA